MKSAKKTKKDLIDELEALQERVCELERREKYSRQTMGNFVEGTYRSFSQMSHMHEAVFVLFDRKLEFVNDRFAELFSVSPEEACSSDFDPMTLIAPESRSVIREQYRKGCCGAFTTKQLNFTGLSKDGLKIVCETFLLCIPYKWGVAIHGSLHSISLSGRIDETWQKRHSNLRVVSNTTPTGILNSDRDHWFVKENEMFGKSDGLPIEQIPHVDYPVKPAKGTSL